MVTFQPGQSNVTFEVPTTEDFIVELTENFFIDIVNVTESMFVGIGAPETATVNIMDNEPGVLCVRARVCVCVCVYVLSIYMYS